MKFKGLQNKTNLGPIFFFESLSFVDGKAKSNFTRKFDKKNKSS